MPRLINCVDQLPGYEPILDSQAYWVRLPDGSRLRDGNGKLLAFRNRENASAEAKAVNAFLKANGKEPLARAVPPEPHEYERHQKVVSEAHKNVCVGADTPVCQPSQTRVSAPPKVAA